MQAPRRPHHQLRLRPHPRLLLFDPWKEFFSFPVFRFFAPSPPLFSLNAGKVGIDTSVIIDCEGMIFPHNGNAHVLVGQVNL